MQLIIAEKPSVAKTIAGVLGKGEFKDGYIEGDGFIVSWCVGHLVSLYTPDEYDERYKKYSLEALPIIPNVFKFKVTQATAGQYKVLKNLMQRSDVTELVCATDAGREGECIFRYVYYYARCRKPVKRLWTSSLESSAIRKVFAELKDDSSYDNLYAAGFARAKADWLVGINATRLFSVRHNVFLSVGRVQTPTLAMIVDRYNKAMNFVKEKYFSVDLNCGDFIASSERIDNEADAKRLYYLCNDKSAEITDVTKETKKINPPRLYDLTTLQREANRYCGYTAQQTLDYTQSLYEKKLVTYPRTDSQYITDDMEETSKRTAEAVKSVFSDFAAFSPAEPNISRCINNKKVSDHHALLPTLEITKQDLSKLKNGELNILMLISSRLLLSTSEPHIYDSVKLTVICECHHFYTNSKSVSQNGFKALEKIVKEKFTGNSSKEREENIQNITNLSKITYKNVNAHISEHFTSPPKLFDDDTLLSAMETAGNSDYDENSNVDKKGLGTPATRAGILEILVKREFVKRENKKLLPTEKGINLIKAVPEEVKSAKMTAEWESKLQQIERGSYSDKDFLDGIIEFVSSLVKKYGFTDTSSGLSFSRSPIGICPKCGKKIFAYKKSYSCESGKDGCGFVIWKTICEKEITEVQAKKLLENGKSNLIKGFKSKGGKTFDAYLILNSSTNKVEFDFPKRKKV